MRSRYGFEDDVTINLVDDRGRPLVARMFWPQDGDLGPNEYGNRKVEYLATYPMVALYTPSSRRWHERQDPCGNFFFTLSERQIDATSLTCTKLLKNGKLRLSPGRARNGELKRHSHKLPPEEVAKLREFFAAADGLRALRRSQRRERILTRRAVRNGAHVRPHFHLRERPSGLAAHAA